MHQIQSRMVALVLIVALFLFSGCPSSQSDSQSDSQPENTEIKIISASSVNITPVSITPEIIAPAAVTPTTPEIITNTIVTNAVDPTLQPIDLLLPTPTPIPAADFLPTPTPESSTQSAQPTQDQVIIAQPLENRPLADSLPTNWARIDPSGQRVIFWHHYTKYREKILNEIIDAFNRSNPHGIQVVAVAQGNWGDLFAKTIAALNTTESPNLVIGYQDDLATYYQSNGLIDLNPLLVDATWGFDAESSANFVPGVLESDLFAGLGDVRLGLASDRAQEVLYYNNTWLKRLGLSHPPSTPEEFKSAACAAVQYPFIPKSGGMGYEIAPNASIFTSWVFAFGGDVVDAETRQLRYNSEATKEAMRFLQDMVQDGCATLVSERYGDQTNFGNGNLLFSTSSSSSLYFYGKAAKEGAGFQWSIAAFPYTTETPVMNLHGASIGVLKTTPEQELAAWLFLKHYLSAAMQAKWAKATGSYPVCYCAQAGLGSYLEENPDYAQGIKLLQYSRPEPATPGYGLIRGAIGDAFRDILNGADVEATLDKLNTQANQIATEQAGGR